MRRWPGVYRNFCTLLTFLLGGLSLFAQAVRPIHIAAYNIDAILDPSHHSLNATAAITFAVPDNATEILFDLNPALHVSRVTDPNGHTLPMEESSGAIRVMPTTPLRSGQVVTWTFAYKGIVSPKDGNTASLASVGEPVSYLLTSAEWFPTSKLETDRFTAILHIHVPAGQRVFASGAIGTPHLDSHGRMVFDFDWKRPGFPGTVIAGKFGEPYTFGPTGDVHLFLIDGNRSIDKANAGRIAVRATQLFAEFLARFGPLPSRRLNLVELPKNAVPAYSAPELAAIASPNMLGAEALPLLANTIAHQWWGERVSPATRNDAWITNGMCRYAGMETLRKNSTPAVFLDSVRNISASALAYDAVPLSRAAQYAPFSPQFEALTYDKGAMVLRMLRWQIGESAFHQTLHGILAKDTPVTSAEVERLAESASRQDLRPFFTQWLDSTGAPALTNKWTLYRLGENRGYLTQGEISEDLDVFRMPVEVRIKTKDRTIDRRVETIGPQSQYAIETTEIPRTISLDPGLELLRTDPAMRVRVHILRGRNLFAHGNPHGRQFLL